MGVFNKKTEPEKVKPIPSVTKIPLEKKRDSVIGKTLSITGDVKSDEQVTIEGKIAGKINISNRVIVGRSGVVNADIEANEVVIEGLVNGNVKGFRKVEVVPQGTLNGNIISQRVVLAEGAIFKGNIDMTMTDEK